MARINWKTRVKKVARATVAALVSIWALYVVLINVFLSTSLFDRVVNFDKMMLDVHYESGWSIWPTSIHAKHLSIRSSDSNVAWVIKLDEVTFEMSLLDIPRRRFTVNHADGRGISMRVQTKRMTWPDHQDEIKHLPPIDGFPAFGVSPTAPHHPELWDDDQYELITVSLDDVHAHDVREIWIDNYRFAGHADIDGRFYLKPLRAVDVGPVHATFHSGEFQQGPDITLAYGLSGTADLTASRFDPREVHKNEAMRYIDVDTDLRARSIEVSKLPFALPIDLYTAGIIDAHDIGVHIRKGHLADGASFGATVEGAHLAHGGYIGDGLLAVRAKVENGRLHAAGEFAGWRVIRADAEEIMLAPRTYVSLDSHDLDLSSTPFEDLHVSAGVDRATVPDARLTNCILPCTVRVHGGRAALTARTEFWPYEKRMSASGRVEYDDVHASVPELDGRGSGDVRAVVASYRWDTGVMEGFEIHGELFDGAVTAQPVPLRRIRTGKGTIDFRAERLELADPLRADWDADLALTTVSTEEGLSVAHADLGLSHRPNTMAVTGKVDGGRVVHGTQLSFLPFRLASEKGEFRAEANLVNQDDVIRGQVKIRTERLGIETKKVAAIGNADIAVDIREFIADKVLDLGPSKLEVRNAFGKIAGKPAFTAELIELDGVARQLDLRSPKLAAIDAHLVVDRLAAPDASAFQALLPANGKVKITGGAVNVSGEIALGGKDGASGDLTVDAERGSFAHGESTATGDARIVAKVTGVSDELVNLSGSKVTLRNVDVQRSTFETAQWHGDVVLDDAIVDWTDGEPGFGADVVLTAQDARPVLGMLHTPKIAGAFVTMPNLAMRAHVDADANGVVMRDIYAHGGDVAFRGTYAVVEGDKRGAFVVAKGPLAVGVRVGNDGIHPRFFGLDGWLREEEKKVKAAPKTPSSSKP